MKARLVTRVTPTIERWSLCWERRPISLPPPPRHSLLRELLASKLKSSTSALWDIWTKAFSGSGRKQCPARWHNTQADLQWLHSSRRKDYFTGLSEERAGILIYMDGWRHFPMERISLFQTVWAKGGDSHGTRATRKVRRSWLTFSRNKSLVFWKILFFFSKMEPKSEGKTLLMCVAIKRLILVWGENSEIFNTLYFSDG